MFTTASKPTGGRTPTRRSFRDIFTRYAIGSVLAGAASEVVLLLTYGPGLLGPQAASVAGWAAGAVLNYGLNRRWAWGRAGRANLWRELLPYWAITLVTLAVSVWATGMADRLGPRIFASSEGLRMAFVGGAFLAVYGLMFVVKFALYHYLIFAGDSSTRPGADSDGPAAGGEEGRRSRHHVVSTTRK